MASKKSSPKIAPSPSPKTGTTTELDLVEDKKEKPVKEIPIIHDQGFFTYETGDTYNGEFEAKKKDHSVKMQGEGVYTTAEGDIYTGHWEADKLVSTGITVISFADGSKFEGIIKDWAYTGTGKYLYPDGSVLVGEFVDNCPVGNLILTDPNGHIWLGKAEHGYGWFEPVNHFYDMLETSLSRSKRRHKNVAEADNTSSPVLKSSPTSKASPTLKFAHTIKSSSPKTSPTLSQKHSSKASPTKASPPKGSSKDKNKSKK